jgi:hypothetical protein
MAIQELKIWGDRWESLKSSMEALSNRMGSSSFDHQDTLPNLLECLTAFAESQFNYFRNGFDAKGPFLEYSPAFPPEYVLRTTLDQIAFDLGVIQRAFHQRLATQNSAKAINTLAKADILAYKALKPAIKQGLIGNTTAVTYFQKQAVIRVVPYAPVALIGIPYTSVHAINSDANVRDLLAIPHEVGHYVFWHGYENGERLSSRLFDKVPMDYAWLYPWLEEIFADAYGCLIAGPVIALDFQELQLDAPPDEFTEDDGEHPVPALRPQIYTDLLRAIGSSNSAQALDELWDKHLMARNRPTSFRVRKATAGHNETRQLAEARHQIKEVTDNFMATLNALHPDQRGANPPWSNGLPGMVKADEVSSLLYKKFEDYLDDLFPKPEIDSIPEDRNIAATGKVPKLRKTDNNKMILDSIEDGIQDNERELGKATPRFEDLKNLNGNKDSKIPSEIWSLVFSMSGWATGGPDTEQIPKSGG